jgi:uncharacterized protein
VYCAEGVDNGGAALRLSLADTAVLQAKPSPGLLGGVTVVTAAMPAGPVTLIPYYAWSNRGVGEMAVWLKRQ